jgi:hypothetical protein
MELWYPAAERRNGVHASYDKGKTREQAVKVHYTVCTNSTGIGDRGYFTWLISRNGHVAQFAPADALCWDSGEWNDAGPGIEFEFYEPKDGPAPANILTGAQIAAAGPLVRWLAKERGYPLTFYDGSRVAETSGYRGFITHRSLVQAEQHTDYITEGQWAQIVGPAQIEEDDVPNRFIAGTSTGPWYFYNGNTKTFVDGARAQLLVDLGLVKSKAVAVVGQAVAESIPDFKV